ncbi:flagellar protein FlaG [Clostridium gasigenes]|uniref:flagellar protein FlaG n=1 Tax=Clostridium gasigenes TaxID=94869 RepID=UPI001C0D002B|nr:flagellar protein FlaG [Clostridium gasigenes]MBU3109066.1 flagellar protein FlaG [Clostridium gasigenes]
MKIGVMGESGQVSTEFKKADFKKRESNEITEIKCIGKRYKEEEIAKAVDKLNKLLQEDNTTVEYSIHEVFGDTMIKIINKNTKEVLVEVPPKTVLDLVAKMCERAGILIDKKS